MYKLCDTCENIKVKDNKIMTKNNGSWELFPHHLPILGRTNGSQKTLIDLGKKHANCLIYYWAAKNMIYNLNIQYPDSYKNSDNNGLVKLDNEGKAHIYLDCPQPYKEDNISYMNHIHILVSNKAMTKWNNNFYTQNVLCNIDKKDVSKYINNKNRLIINALSEDYFKQAKIPGSFNLFYKQAKKMSKKQIDNSIKKMIEKSESLKKLLKTYKLKLEEVPIIVYCYNTHCDASMQLANELFKNGYTNILDYEGGIIDYLGR